MTYRTKRLHGTGLELLSFPIKTKQEAVPCRCSPTNRRLPAFPFLHLGLDLLKQRLELLHIRLLLRPANAEALLLVGFRDLIVSQSAPTHTMRPGRIWATVPCGSAPKSLQSAWLVEAACGISFMRWQHAEGEGEERQLGPRTWPISWCAPRPLFCRMLYSCAPVATTSFLATGYRGGKQRERREKRGQPSRYSMQPLRVLHPAQRSGQGRGSVPYQNLGKVVVGDVGQLLAVELGDYELRAPPLVSFKSDHITRDKGGGWWWW